MSSSSESSLDWTEADLPGPDLTDILRDEALVKCSCNEEMRSQIHSDLEFAVFLQNQEAELMELSPITPLPYPPPDEGSSDRLSLSSEDEPIPISTFSLAHFVSDDDSNDDNVLETLNEDILEALDLTPEQQRQLLELMRNDSVNYSVPGLKESQIKRLQRPCIVSANTDDNCGICITEFMAGDRQRVLKCNHYFHAHCIDKWLQKTALCPLCRNKVIPPRRLGLSRCIIL